jgi:predicted RNA methylase
VRGRPAGGPAVNRAQVEALPFTTDPALSFWPTPAEVADDLVYLALEPWHCLGNGIRVLEPSAGDGHLARAVRYHLPHASITAVEPCAQRAAGLRTLTNVVDEVVEDTLEHYLAGARRPVDASKGERPGHTCLEGGAFDLVVMNPPFTLPGRPEAWAEHVLAIYHAPHLLAPDGTLCAVVPHIALTGQSRLVRAVRDLLGPGAARYTNGSIQGDHGLIDPCERGAFGSSGVAVSCALLWAHLGDSP